MQWARAFIVGLVGLSLTAGCTGEKCRAHIKGGCARGWRQWCDFCYNVTVQSFVDQSLARQECARMGAVMAAPQSDEENAFFHTLETARHFWIDCDYLSGMFPQFPRQPVMGLSFYTS